MLNTHPKEFLDVVFSYLENLLKAFSFITNLSSPSDTRYNVFED